MAAGLSLSSHHVKQAIHTSSLSNTPLQPYSTPRQFTTVKHGSKTDHETFSKSQTPPPLLSSGFGQITHDDDINKLAPSSQVAPDLPCWTPLRTLEDDEGLSASDQEAGELVKRKIIGSPMKQLTRLPPRIRATVEIPVIEGRTAKLLAAPKPSQGKRARFDGVLIATRSPSYRKLTSAQAQYGPAPASSTPTFSLVDALARTFDANRHTEDSLPRQPRPASRQHDVTSAGPQTDVETTEAEDEQLQLNTRLAHPSLKRQHERPVRRILARSANASETNSEDATSLLQDVPQPERPIKRLKAIQYEANPTLIDAALGTIQAPISWDAEMDIITRDEDFVTPAQAAQATSADEPSDHTTSFPFVPLAATAQTPTENEWHVPTRTGGKVAVLSPYQSRGARFRQRLHAIFGENTTVRTDKIARPRPVDLDFFALDGLDREPSPSVSASTVSASSASAVEDVASAVPSTHITSQSPDIPPPDTHYTDASYKEQLDEAGSSTRPVLGADEHQVNVWIVALQRLVKGKVHINEEGLDALSIVLAEIESVKDSLDPNVAMTTELRESVKQLSELHDIPFGDRNKLRWRAGNIFLTWPSIGKPGAT